MVTVRSYTDAKIDSLIADNIVDARLQDGSLIVKNRGGVEKNLGSVKGATGSAGGSGSVGSTGATGALADTGWIPFPATGMYGPNVTIYHSSYAPAYRKIGKEVRFCGLLLVTSAVASDGTLFTTPTGFRTSIPIDKHHFIAPAWTTQNITTTVAVLNDGRVTIQQGGVNYAWLSIDGISFWTE